MGSSTGILNSIGSGLSRAGSGIAKVAGRASSGIAAGYKPTVDFLGSEGGSSLIGGLGKIASTALVSQERKSQAKKITKGQEEIIDKRESELEEKKKDALKQIKYQRMSRSNFRGIL